MRFIVWQRKHDGKQSPLQICCAQFQHVFNLHELKLGGVYTKGQNNNTAIADSLSSLKETAALTGHHCRDSNKGLPLLDDVQPRYAHFKNTASAVSAS